MGKSNLSKIVSQLKVFILLLFGQSVSQIGTSMTSFAILIWVYTKNGSVLTVSLLSICTLIPYLIVSLVGGAITDRSSKKAIMLICDTVAAACSLVILLCLLTNSLEIWHLYIVNAVSGLMNAFQAPASEVAVTLIVPKEHYTRVGGIKSAVSSGLGILVPVFAASVLAFGGLKTVILIDLCTFVFAFITLLFVKIPKAPCEHKENPDFGTIKKDISSAFTFLKTKKGILYLIVFFALDCNIYFFA